MSDRCWTNEEREAVYESALRMNHGVRPEDMKCPQCGGDSFGSCASRTAPDYHFYHGPMKLTCNRCGHHFERPFEQYRVKR